MELFREVIKCRNCTNEYLKLYERWSKDLNSIDIMILDYITENPGTHSKDISKVLKVDPAYASRRVGFLEQKEYISRVLEGRAKKIVLTEKGHRIVGEIGRERDEIYRRLSENLSSEEIGSAIKVLKTVSKVIQM